MIIERFAALRTGITEGYLFVDAEEIAPASQFVEGTLLVAVTDIGLIGEACADEVVVVVELRVEADAERIVVQMLLVPADVAIVDDEVVECTVNIVRDSSYLVVARFLC